MRAVVKTAPVDGRDGTAVLDRPVPSIGPDDVLVRVGATAICGTDKHIFHWDRSIQSKVTPPRIYGHEFCGFIEEIGSNVRRTDLEAGDYVSAEMHIICDECPQCRTGNGHICQKTKIYGLHEDGCFAEFVRVPASNIIKLDSRYVPLHVGAFLDALGNAVHTTQVVDLVGKSVAITGFGPIGAMAAAIAEHTGASSVIVTDISDEALSTASKWAARKGYKNFHPFNVRTADPVKVKKDILDISNGGVDVVLEMSGAPSAINLGLDIVGMGGFLSLLGLPAGDAVNLENYTRNVVFKGVTLKGIIGRQMYGTWQRMLGMLESGLDVEWITQAEYDSLDDFYDGVDKFDRHEALKVVFYPAGKKDALERLSGSKQAMANA